MSLGYDDTDYEIYDSEKIKYKRKFVKKPLYMNFRVIIVLSVIFDKRPFKTASPIDLLSSASP